jgi:hypothetical protein
MTNILKDFVTEAGANRYAARMSEKHTGATFTVLTMGGTWYVALGN